MEAYYVSPPEIEKLCPILKTDDLKVPEKLFSISSLV